MELVPPQVSTVIVAHTSRRDAAQHLAEIVGAREILEDDGTLGAGKNHRRAWEWHHLNSRAADWCLVLEDDAVPADDFAGQLAAALTDPPADIVSLYLGTDRPRHWQGRVLEATRNADDLGAAWIVTTHLLHAVAVAARPRLAPYMVRWTRYLDSAIDARRVESFPIAYTWPSLCDHADGPTVAEHGDGKPRAAPRVAWRHGGRDYWRTPAVTM